MVLDTHSTFFRQRDARSALRKGNILSLVAAARARRTGFQAKIAILVAALFLQAQPSVASKEAAHVSQVRSLETDNQAVRFAIVGDRTGLARPGIFEDAIAKLELLHPEFVVNTGDLVEGYTADPKEIESEWTNVRKIISRLTIPFFFVAGNHDMGNEQMLKNWSDNIGETYYSFRYKDALFLVLNTEDPPLDMPPFIAAIFHQSLELMATDPEAAEHKLGGVIAKVKADRMAGRASPEVAAFGRARFSQSQVRYALDVLQRNRDVRWTFVFMHKPAWRLGSSEFTEIEKALADRPYTVIAGHEHYYSHEVRSGRDYIVTGPAGASPHKEGPGRIDHVTWVTLPAKGAPHIALLRLDGIFGPSFDSLPGAAVSGTSSAQAGHAGDID